MEGSVIKSLQAASVFTVLPASRKLQASLG